jgi:hypothetical protein
MHPILPRQLGSNALARLAGLAGLCVALLLLSNCATSAPRAQPRRPPRPRCHLHPGPAHVDRNARSPPPRRRHCRPLLLRRRPRRRQLCRPQQPSPLLRLNHPRLHPSQWRRGRLRGLSSPRLRLHPRTRPLFPIPARISVGTAASGALRVDRPPPRTAASISRCSCCSSIAASQAVSRKGATSWFWRRTG